MRLGRSNTSKITTEQVKTGIKYHPNSKNKNFLGILNSQVTSKSIHNKKSCNSQVLNKTSNDDFKPTVKLAAPQDLSGFNVEPLSTQGSMIRKGMLCWKRQAKNYIPEEEIFQKKIKLMRDVHDKVEEDLHHTKKFLSVVKDTEDEKVEYKGYKNLDDDEQKYFEDNYENIMWRKIQDRWNSKRNRGDISYLLDKKDDLQHMQRVIDIIKDQNTEECFNKSVLKKFNQSKSLIMPKTKHYQNKNRISEKESYLKKMNDEAKNYCGISNPDDTHTKYMKQEKETKTSLTDNQRLYNKIVKENDITKECFKLSQIPERVNTGSQAIERESKLNKEKIEDIYMKFSSTKKYEKLYQLDKTKIKNQNAEHFGNEKKVKKLDDYFLNDKDFKKVKKNIITIPIYNNFSSQKKTANKNLKEKPPPTEETTFLTSVANNKFSKTTVEAPPTTQNSHYEERLIQKKIQADIQKSEEKHIKINKMTNNYENLTKNENTLNKYHDLIESQTSPFYNTIELKRYLGKKNVRQTQAEDHNLEFSEKNSVDDEEENKEEGSQSSEDLHDRSLVENKDDAHKHFRGTEVNIYKQNIEMKKKLKQLKSLTTGNIESNPADQLINFTNCFQQHNNFLDNETLPVKNRVDTYESSFISLGKKSEGRIQSKFWNEKELYTKVFEDHSGQKSERIRKSTEDEPSEEPSNHIKQFFIDKPSMYDRNYNTNESSMDNRNLSKETTVKRQRCQTYESFLTKEYGQSYVIPRKQITVPKEKNIKHGPKSSCPIDLYDYKNDRAFTNGKLREKIKRVGYICDLANMHEEAQTLKENISRAKSTYAKIDMNNFAKLDNKKQNDGEFDKNFERELTKIIVLQNKTMLQNTAKKLKFFMPKRKR